ncbi:MAG TPA: ABC transporter ATP-binding protein [Isosphaeraceae bacterium]
MGQQQQDGSATSLWGELRGIARMGPRVWGLVPRPQKWALLGAVAVMGITSTANTAIPVYLGKLVDSVNPQAERALGRDEVLGVATRYLALIGGAYLIRELFNVLRRYLAENACTRIDKQMCVRLVSHLMQIDLATLTHEQVGALHGRIIRSVDGFVRFLRLSFLDFVPAILMGSFALAAALSKQPRMALVMAGVAPLSIALTLWQLVTQKGVRLGLMRTREMMDGTVVEQLSGLDYIRVANTHAQEVRRVAAAAEQRRAKEIRHHFQMSLFGCGKALNEGTFHLLVIACALYLFLAGKIQYGEILTFSVLFLTVMSPLNEIHRFIDEAHECSLRVNDLVDILNQPVDRSFRPIEPRTPILDEDGIPLFVVDQLRVDYHTADGQTRRALVGVSMEIRHGETIGVAGRSGCGKTTWLRALMRLIHPSGGSVLLGGVHLESVSREAIGDLIGYVGQNPFIFAGTIAENIAYGAEGATAERIRDAARSACIHEEVLAMPGGYDARVAERGQNLSGGQRQRIALARVFLKNPPILILDEGTSALDNISERMVQQAIAAARADRTVILVAHRLSTLRDTNRILVFDDGRVVESGTYQELERLGGVFTELALSAEATPEADGPAEVTATPADAAATHVQATGPLPAVPLQTDALTEMEFSA